MKLPHPGWACCDPDQDLAGWLDSQRSRAAEQRARAAGHRALGEWAGAAAVRAGMDGVDVDDMREHQAAERHHHGEANAYAERATGIEAHAARVEAAHAFRLTPNPSTKEHRQ